MNDMREELYLSLVLDLDIIGIPAQVVPGQVDKHDMFGVLFGVVGEALGNDFVIFIIAGAATASSRTTPTVSSRENVRRDSEGVVLKPGPAPRTPRSRVDEEDERLATPPTQIDRARELRRREALDDYSEPRRAVGQ